MRAPIAQLSVALLFFLSACGQAGPFGDRLTQGMSEQTVIANFGKPTLVVDQPNMLARYGADDGVTKILTFKIDNPDKTDTSDSHLLVIVSFDDEGVASAKSMPTNSLGRAKRS